MDDAVVVARRDAGRRATGNEPVEDRLHLVGGGVAGGAQPVPRDRVALLAQRGLGEPGAVELDHLRAELLRAEPRVLVRLLAAQLVAHVDGGDA